MQVTEILLYDTPMSVFVLGEKLEPKQRVVVNVNNTLELGVVKGECETDAIDFAKFVRVATAEDNKTRCDNCREARKLLGKIKKDAEDLGLNMKIGNVSISLDKSKLIVNYTADERVDFRELIKVLGVKYHFRVEMRQIGNRDETKMIGALGICGRETCCKSFLNDFDKVSIKMAKNQNIALNPNRINGMCGRLLCCLKYEDEFYEKMNKIMPKLGGNVTTADGKGKVVALDYLRETVSVEFKKDDESTEVKIYPVGEISVNKRTK